jgi:polyhydroxyalkanoate synthesis regulator phasin
MADRANNRRDLVERVLLAGVGAAALTADRIESLTDELAERGGMTRDEARGLIEDAITRWRGDAQRATERAGEGLQSFFGQLGLVTRDDYEELELRVAQLEHRLRLVEQIPPPKGD